MRDWLPKLNKRWEILNQLHGPGDVMLFLRIFLFALAVPALLRIELPRLMSFLEPNRINSSPTSEQVQKIARYVDGAILVGRPIVRPGCLTRGLTLYYFLRRLGLEISLSFGMGNLQDLFQGHCWLTKDGKPYLEAKDPRPLFSTVYQFPEDATAA